MRKRGRIDRMRCIESVDRTNELSVVVREGFSADQGTRNTSGESKVSKDIALTEMVIYIKPASSRKAHFGRRTRPERPTVCPLSEFIFLDFRGE